MRKEIIIGTNKPAQFNAICMWYMADASENSRFYILNSGITDIRLYIYKQSEEGKAIGNWLACEENRNNESVQRKALELIFPLLTVDEILELIDNEKSDSYDKGYKQAQYDIRKALGL